MHEGGSQSERSPEARRECGWKLQGGEMIRGLPNVCVPTKKEIIELWESRSRSELSNARSQTSLALKDSMPAYLDKLALALDETTSRQAHVSENLKIAEEHGVQRANLEDYNLDQVLLEYRILRQILLTVLERETDLMLEARNIILDWIEVGMSRAADAFLNVVLEREQEAKKHSELFASIAAHDLRQPLQTISMVAQLALKKLGAEKKETKWISSIISSSKHMAALIDNLLSFSAVGESVDFESCDLAETLLTVRKNLADLIQKESANIVVGSLPMISANSSQMNQIFQNLVSNAVQYRGPEAPVIAIEVVDNGNHWKCSVQDNGLGISHKDRTRIFEAFERVGLTKSRGTGLGLAICKKIVEHHGGRIWVESQEGKGSTFYFTISKDLQQQQQQQKKNVTGE